MRKSLLVLPLLLNLVDAGVHGGAPFTNDFTLGIIGDTQRLTHAWGGRTAAENARRLNAITKWHKDHADSLKMAFISHMGDVVDNAGQADQWAAAKAAMQNIKDAGVPWGMVPGNHDVGNAYAEYNTHFPLSTWEGKAWFGGGYPAGKSQNQYQLFAHGGNRFLWLHLENKAPAAAVAWAQGILTQHADRVAFVTTHDYTSERGFEPYGESLWQSLIRKNANIVAVFCGHQFGISYVQRRNDAGKVVHNILVDYQDEADDNLQGATRWMEVNVKENKVYSYTINPGQGNLRLTAPLRPNSFTGWAADSARKSPSLAHHEQQFATSGFFTPPLAAPTGIKGITRRPVPGYHPRGDASQTLYDLGGRRAVFRDPWQQEIRGALRPGARALVVRFKDGGETLLLGWYPVAEAP